jgi:hypothetical protein
MDSIKKLLSALSMIIFAVLPGGTVEGMGTPQKLPHIAIEAQEAKLSTVIIGSASVFMNISNTGESEDTLKEARIDIPGAVVEIHDTKDGKMVKAEKIRIPSRSIVELKPGGLHIMIFKMPEDVKEGHELKMHLLFERSGERQIDVKLKGSDTQSHMHH